MTLEPGLVITIILSGPIKFMYSPSNKSSKTLLNIIIINLVIYMWKKPLLMIEETVIS